MHLKPETRAARSPWRDVARNLRQQRTFAIKRAVRYEEVAQDARLKVMRLDADIAAALARADADDAARDAKAATL